LNPGLVKRALLRDKPSGRKYQNYLTGDEMVVATAEGDGKRTRDAQRKYDAKILEIYGETASLRTDSPD